MTTFLSKISKEIALVLLTILYCQTIVAAYEPWRNLQYQHEQFSNTKKLQLKSAIASNNDDFKKEIILNADKIKHTTTFSFNDNNNNRQDEIGGPTQPEMTAFKSVNDNNMVDLFTGDFSYNIPLLDVGGYPVNLFYKSGITMDQEASWVGLGWNINPGTITRNLRGIPDDFDGKNDVIQKITSVKENKTIGGDIGGDIEIFGFPIDNFLSSGKLSLSAGAGVFYNNYRGWGIENSFNASISAGKPSMGYLNAGLALNNNSQEGLNISPSLSVQLQTQLEHDNSTITGGVSIGGGFSYNSRSGLVGNLSTGVNLSLQQQTDSKSKVLGASGDYVGTNLYGSYISFSSPSYNPSVSIPFTNSQFTFTGKLGGAVFGTHGSIYLKGYVSKQWIADEDIERTFPAYGYLFYQDANDNPQALLDFNREKDIVYRETPDVSNIAIPFYTYDLFSISGEATGGMFRAYRSDIGYVHDPYVTTKEKSDAGSVDLGFGNLFHGGVDINVNHATTTTGAWSEENPLANTVGFKQNDSVYEAAYLRNPGEKSINAGDFYKSIGDDDVVTAQLYQGANGPVITSTNYLQHWKNQTSTNISTLLSNTDFKSKRDKRTQVISYLNAAEASRVGLDTLIYNYNLNQWGQPECSSLIKKEPRINSFRHSNHISEINVLNSDGRRYVYGLPVYNLTQEEVTFAVGSSQGNKTTGMVKYTNADASKSNSQGKDNYFQKEITSSYAHSYLLTGILSPDYVDVTGNGITEDDLGDAIKLNYSKLAGFDSAFGWRTPNAKDNATYNEGLQTYSRDDKGNYIYGEKEMWYLNSIESKNMVAVFILQKRSDLKSLDSNGNVATDTTKSKCLQEIDLYSKSDYIQNGTKAKPIKTVHFFYTYDLCKGINGNSSQGKLTLKKVWFTYNGNNKGGKNPYLFFYNGINPNYTNTAYDRWSNYKNPSQNPRATQSQVITNAEYPYALQDSELSNTNAAAWTMDSIVLPSSGSIKVGYESDDYAYVQNKRAMQMFNVVGLSYNTPSTLYGSSSSSNVSNTLYGSQSGGTTIFDNRFVVVRVTHAVFSAKDVYQQYLEGFQKIYFKLRVEMPTDLWGSGYEYVPVYADLDINTISDSSNYGVMTGHSDLIWFKLKGINAKGDEDGDFSPLAKTAIQFLRLNLPSKAYPGYETGDKLDVGFAVKMIGMLGSNIFHAFTSFDANARSNGWAIQIDTSKTLARLDNPIFKKYGGGLRVKYVKIYDNWKNMTDSSKQAVYGRTYDYSTIKNINGTDTRISSGVASWEPMMGREENPFILPLEFIEKVAPLAPVTMGYTELPLGETFFPAPSIGYSQVRMRSIHSFNIKSATGYEETKFYTSYDFPTITDNSLFTPDTKKRYKTSFREFLRINTYHFLSMSQGFKIELNDMNGKIKSQASYAETDSVHPIASSQYYYHVDDQNAEFKHLNNIVKTVNQNGEIDTTSTIGKDIELMMDMRQQQSITQGNDYGLNVDVFIIFLFPIPVPSYIPMPQREETRFQSVATTKIIQRFGILDSVVVIDKGSKVSTDNLLYDSETGDVLLTRTRNEFNDTLYDFNYSAHWAYSGMGPAYQNIDAVFDNLKITNGVLQSSSKYPGILNHIESGDELLAEGEFKNGADSSVGCGEHENCPTPTYAENIDTIRIWAVDAKRINPTGTLGTVFIDRNGNPFTGHNLKLKIIRSGHRNLSMTPIGTVAMLKSPLRTVNNKLQLVIDSNKNILSTAAASFNETWRVADARKSLHVSYTCACSPLKELFDYLINSHRLFIQQSDGITVGQLVSDAHAAGKDISIDDCSLLKNNYSFLFYTSSTDSIDASYSAHIGYNTVSIQSNSSTDIHFYSLESQECNGENRVYYKDSYNPMKQYILYNNSDHTVGYSYEDCDGHGSEHHDTLQALHDVLICAREDGLDLPQDGSITPFYQSPCTACATANEIYLSVDSCEDCISGICFNPILDTTFNPYVYGLLGNWRNQKSYVYYGNRREANPAQGTNIRSNGVIQNFRPYWSFSTTYLTSTSDTSIYVWNSQSTLFNKKGFELENKDPLGRYNAGAYGYNETLPIDVVQNSQYKDQFFDGFEDYNYTSQSCSQNCPLPRTINFATGNNILTDNISHTGKYSLMISGLDSSVQNFKIIDSLFDDSQKINVLRDTSIVDTSVSMQGNGLTITKTNDTITGYSGYIQTNISGYYVITCSISCAKFPLAPAPPTTTPGFTVTVDNVSEHTDVYGTSNFNDTVFLTAGVKIFFSAICHAGSYFNTSLDLNWQRLPCAETVDIPQEDLYQSSLNDNVTYGPPLCRSFLGIKTDSTSIISGFKPSIGNRMIFSAWVKEQKDCLCQQYDSNRVNFTFTRSQHSDTVLSFKPTGNIIEGWQRYDTVIDVPPDATSMRIALKSTGNSPVYFDDIRMLPFNANMKSYVYDLVSLRLVAELDENNYATFYEYDDDGTLIRLKKETERGIQTIKETRSSLSELNNQ